MIKVSGSDGTTVLIRENPQLLLNIKNVRVCLDKDEVSKFLSMQNINEDADEIPNRRVLRSKVIPPKGFFCETIPDSDEDSAPEILTEIPTKKRGVKKVKKAKGNNNIVTPQPEKNLRTPSPDIAADYPRPNSTPKLRLREKVQISIVKTTEVDREIPEKICKLTGAVNKPKLLKKHLKGKEKSGIIKRKDKLKSHGKLKKIKERLSKCDDSQFKKTEKNPEIPNPDLPKPEENSKPEVNNPRIILNHTNAEANVPSCEASTSQATSNKGKTSPKILAMGKKNQDIPLHRKKEALLPKINKNNNIHRRTNKPEKNHLFPAPLGLLRPFKIPRISKRKPTENHVVPSRPVAVAIQSPESPEMALKAQIRKLFLPSSTKTEHFPELSLLSVLKEKNNVSFQSVASIVEDHQTQTEEVLIDSECEEITIVAEFRPEKTHVNPEGTTDEDSNNSSSSTVSEPIDCCEVLLLHPEDRDLYRLF